MTNTTVVEIVKFQQQGMTEIQARTKAMGVEIADATTKAETFARLLNDPRYDKFVQRVEGARKQFELLGLKARNVALANSLADGSAVKQLRSTTKLNEQYTRMRRELELSAKYGSTLGKFLARHGDTISAAGRIGMVAAGAGVATLGGLAHRGFEGTVNKARFDAEMLQLSRSVAAAFVPLMTIATKFARVARVGSDSLGRGGQDRLMGAGVVAAGTLGTLATARFLGLPIGQWGASALRAVGQVGPNSAGGTAGTGLARLGGAAFQGYEAYRGMQDVHSESSQIRGTARSLLTWVEKWTGQEFIARNVFGLKRGAAIGQTFDAIFGENENNPRGGDKAAWGDAARRAMGAGAEGGGRRSVMLSGGGFEDVESSFDRLQSAIDKVQGDPNDTSEEGLGPLLHKLYTVLDRLEKRLGGGDLDRPGGG